jgi:hypothetical protein
MDAEPLAGHPAKRQSAEMRACDAKRIHQVENVTPQSVQPVGAGRNV